eukprot:3543966-Prymnesium_polylepis.2
MVSGTYVHTTLRTLRRARGARATYLHTRGALYHAMYPLSDQCPTNVGAQGASSCSLQISSSVSTSGSGRSRGERDGARAVAVRLLDAAGRGGGRLARRLGGELLAASRLAVQQLGQLLVQELFLPTFDTQFLVHVHVHVRGCSNTQCQSDQPQEPPWGVMLPSKVKDQTGRARRGRTACGYRPPPLLEARGKRVRPELALLVDDGPDSNGTRHRTVSLYRRTRRLRFVRRVHARERAVLAAAVRRGGTRAAEAAEVGAHANAKGLHDPCPWAAEERVRESCAVGHDHHVRRAHPLQLLLQRCPSHVNGRHRCKPAQCMRRVGHVRLPRVEAPLRRRAHLHKHGRQQRRARPAGPPRRWRLVWPLQQHCQRVPLTKAEQLSGVGVEELCAGNAGRTQHGSRNTQRSIVYLRRRA